MRVMVFVQVDEQVLRDSPPTAEAFAAMDEYNDELVAAGVFVAGAGLKPTAEARRIIADGEARTVIDGPFAESKEVIAGFAIWEVGDMDEAVAWARRCPNPAAGRSTIEIRPFLELADLADPRSPTDPASPHEGERGRLGVA